MITKEELQKQIAQDKVAMGMTLKRIEKLMEEDSYSQLFEECEALHEQAAMLVVKVLMKTKG